MGDIEKMPPKSETYLKDNEYTITYINKDGEQTEGKYTPKKDTTKVGVMAGFKNENPDYFKLVKITESKSKKEENMEEVTAGNIKQMAMKILPKEDIDIHDSDLYLKVSDKSTELINRMKDKDSGLLSKFKSQIDNQMWYEIPFANANDNIKEKVQEYTEYGFSGNSLDKHDSDKNEEPEYSVKIEFNNKDNFNLNESKLVESKEIKVGDFIAVVDYEDDNTIGYNIYENEEDYRKDIVMDYYEVSKETAEQDIKELMTDVFNEKREQEIYYLQDKVYNYEKRGVGTEEEYEQNLERLHHLQAFDGSDESLFESKSLTESDDTVTEYVITFTDIRDDEIFSNKDDADKRFEEIRINGEIDTVSQYFRKDWEFEDGEYVEGYVEIFYNQGDILEEDANMSGYVHITFTDGSNPYIKFTDSKKEADAELKKWSKNFNITVNKNSGGKIFVTAEPKDNGKSDLFDFSEELEEN